MMDIITTEIGAGRVRDRYTLTLPAVDANAYHDAQITNYGTDHRFTLKPPLRLTLTAWATDLRGGTAGFGLWNHPFAPNERRLRLPKAAWFFYGAPPNNMALARDIPGYGWKCATIDAANWRFLSLLPTAPLGFVLMRLPAAYRRLWPFGQRVLKVSEHWISEHIPAQAHTYRLDWLPDRVIFAIDGVIIHTAPIAPRGKLGFIAWVDNQYAVVTPQGQFDFGLVATDSPANLMLQDLTLVPLQPQHAHTL
jgi:hypothetical protein